MKPTNTELLAEFGFEATPEGLAEALDSPSPFARIYALRVISEQKDPRFLPQAKVLLKHEFIKVQLEAAKLLAQFDRPEGLSWLRGWEKRVGDDPAISDDHAHVVLDAASALAERGDERLARQVHTCLRHKSWAVKFHAARALGSFTDLSKPALENAWTTSAGIAIAAMQSKPQVQDDYIHLYLKWLSYSATKQTHSTPKITAKFASLAAVDHVASITLRREIDQRFRAIPAVAQPKKPGK
jgi:HEAT repeat protein